MRPELQSLSGVYMADIEHHPGQKGPQAGPYYPSMLTHGSRYSWSAKRFSTSLECFAVHGLHVFPECGQHFPSPILDVLKQLEPKELNHLSGNSLLCPLAGAFVFYCLANLQPLPQGNITPNVLAVLESSPEAEELCDDKLLS